MHIQVSRVALHTKKFAYPRAPSYFVEVIEDYQPNQGSLQYISVLIIYEI